MLEQAVFLEPGALTNFVNGKHISKDQIVNIVCRDNTFILFYWVEKI